MNPVYHLHILRQLLDQGLVQSLELMEHLTLAERQGISLKQQLMSQGILTERQWERARNDGGITPDPGGGKGNLLSCPECGYTVKVIPSPHQPSPPCLFCPQTLQPGAPFGEPAPPPSSSSAQKTPQKLMDRYQILEELGQGGMGVVYKAWDPQLERTVALKIISHRSASKKVHVERFLKEARLVAGLNHPRIASLYDAGEILQQPFFTMAYIEGENLRQWVEREGCPPPERALELIEQLAQGVAYAHSQGVIHRDIKPENVLLDGEGNPFLVDFGLAREVRENTRLTQTGAVLGSPEFMSPEQARGEKNLEYSTDLYSLGALLYFLLSGQSPFDGDLPFFELLIKVMNDPPPSLAKSNSHLPPAIVELVERAMAKAPEERFAGMDDFQLAVKQISHRKSWRDTLVIQTVGRAKGGVLLALGCLLGLGLGYLLFSPSSAPSPGERQSPSSSEDSKSTDFDKVEKWWKASRRCTSSGEMDLLVENILGQQSPQLATWLGKKMTETSYLTSRITAIRALGSRLWPGREEMRLDILTRRLRLLLSQPRDWKIFGQMEIDEDLCELTHLVRSMGRLCRQTNQHSPAKLALQAIKQGGYECPLSRRLQPLFSLFPLPSFPLKNPTFTPDWGLILIYRGQYRKALEVLTFDGAGEHKDLIHLYRSMAYGQLQQNQRALNELAQAIQLRPKWGVAHHFRGLAYMGLKQIAQAEEELLLSIKYAPHLAYSHYNIALLSQRHSDWRTTYRHLAKAMILNPFQANLYNNLLRRNRRRRRHRGWSRNWRQIRTLMSYSHFTSHSPWKIEGYNNLGLTYRRLGYLSQANLYFRFALTLNPKYLPTLLNLGACLAQQKKWRQSLACFDEVISREPELARGYYHRAMVNCQRKKWDFALKDIQKALKIEPHNSVFWKYLGAVYYNQKKLDQALKALTQALSQKKIDGEAYFFRGNTWRELGENHRAARDYREFLRIFPNNNYQSKLEGFIQKHLEKNNPSK